MTLREHILTYREDDKIKANLFDYFEDYIKPLDSKYKYSSFYDSRLILCFFKDHEDTDPSLGYINDRFHKGVKLYHCFGCGKTGDVVRLNQLINSQYHGLEMTEEESCKDLALKYNIPIDDYEDLDDDDYFGNFNKSLRTLNKLSMRYSSQDFKQNLLMIRMRGGVADLRKINSETVKLIATNKQLYD